jgi:formate dehydrogenase major subunit
MMDGAGRLKALWAIGYDIYQTNPNVNATKRAVASLDLVIVQDMFLNEIVREFAHVFLPVASSFGTHAGASEIQTHLANLNPEDSPEPGCSALLCGMPQVGQS